MPVQPIDDDPLVPFVPPAHLTPAQRDLLAELAAAPPPPSPEVREAAEQLRQVREEQEEHDPTLVRVCTTVPRGNGDHVVDEDAPDASLCGREVVAVVPRRKLRKPCRGCRAELLERVDAGQWKGPRRG